MSISWEGLLDMHYIYCYTNKLNNHRYVGQTNNLQRRIREHRSCAFNEKSSSYNDLIHQKIREYGEENFEIEVLEKLYTDDQNLVDDRERYWIKRFQSYCGTGLGYNRTFGGQGSSGNKNSLDSITIQNIKTDIKSGISFLEIEKKYRISAGTISSINHGIRYYEEEENYPLRKYYKEDEEYDELINLLINSNLSLAEIARQLNMGYSTVKKINSGRLRNGLYPTYPIRKTNRSDRIKNYLINSNKTIHEIAQLMNCSEETVKRINKGETFKDSSITYPIRNL